MEMGFFALTFGAESEQCKQQFVAGNFTALKTCPLVLGGMDDVDGHIGLEVMKQSGIDDPIIKARSHNVGTLLKLAVRGVGGCFCPRNSAQATLTEKQENAMLVFSLGKKAKYPIRFGFKESSYQWSVIEEFLECARKAKY